MSDNYAVINGKKIELTEKQIKALGFEIRKPLFERVTDGGLYYFISCYGDIDADSREDDRLFDNVNYFNDEYFANQVALHQLLYRKLLKFSYDNECEDTAEWDGNSSHWAIRYNANLHQFDSYCQNAYKAPDVYFDSEEGAKRAIHEVVEPFMEEHTEFVW